MSEEQSDSHRNGQSLIDRPAWDDKGGRWATCTRCGMGWCEYREPVELFPGEWTTAGGRPHDCPEPLPYATAKQMTDTAAAVGGFVVSQRMKAAIRLGLEAGPDA